MNNSSSDGLLSVLVVMLGIVIGYLLGHAKIGLTFGLGLAFCINPDKRDMF